MKKELFTFGALLSLMNAPVICGATLNITLNGCRGPFGNTGPASPCDLQARPDPVFAAYDVSFGLRGPNANTWNANLLSESQLQKAVGVEAFQDYLQAFDLGKTCQPFTYDCQLALFALFNPGIKTNNGGKYWTAGADSIFGAVEAKTFRASAFSALIPTEGCGAEPSCYVLPPGTAPTPEPASLLLIGTGIIGLCLHRRRKKSA